MRRHASLFIFDDRSVTVGKCSLSQRVKCQVENRGIYTDFFDDVTLCLVVPERIWKWEHPSGAKRRKFFFGSCPSTFLALKVQLVVLVSAFVMVSTVWSASCLLFYSRYPLCPKESAQLFVPTSITWRNLQMQSIADAMQTVQPSRTCQGLAVGPLPERTYVALRPVKSYTSAPPCREGARAVYILLSRGADFRLSECRTSLKPVQKLAMLLSARNESAKSIPVSQSFGICSAHVPRVV